MKAKEVEKLIRDDLKKLGERVAKRMAEPTKTWQDIPRFIVSEPAVRGGDLVCRIRTDDSLGADKYFWLNEGTSVKYVVVGYNSGWRPKTKVRSFTARRGSPGPGIMNTYPVQYPGIEAREWTPMIAEEFEPILGDVLDRIVNQYSGKLFGKIDRFAKYEE